MADSAQTSAMKAASSSATTPSGANGHSDGPKRDRHSSTSAVSRLTLPSQSYPVTRTPSAPFPVTRTPSAKGIAMIRTTEDSPPPTNLTFEDAVRILHATERRLREETQSEIVDLRLQMTASKIEKVTFKASRLHALRTLLNNCRVLCRQEEDVMKDFGKVKDRLSSIRGDIDEDSYQDTKAECLFHGGKLTDIKRRQRRLAGHAEVMREELVSVMAPEDITSAGEDEEKFDVDRFKRESSQQPMFCLTATPLTSYPLFNSAPYSRGPSGDKLNQQMNRSYSPSVSSTLPSHAKDSKSSRIGSSRAADIPGFSVEDTSNLAATNSYPTTEDEQEQAYFPSHRKKKSVLHKRPKTTSMSSAVSSDTDGEEYNWTNDKSILQSNAALIEAKLKRKEQLLNDDDEEDDAASRVDDKVVVNDEIKQKEEEDAIRKAVEEQLEKEAKEQEEKDKTKAEEQEKRKLAAEKRKAELEAKKKEAEEKKRLEEEEKKRVIEEKRKADIESKKKAIEEKKKLESEKKIKEEEDKLKAEEEKKKKAAAVTKRLEEKKAQAKKLEDDKKNAEEEKKKLEEAKKEEMAAKQKAIADKKLADIEAKKAEQESAKHAEEERLKSETELKEKEAQEEKYARLEKIEADKQKAWEEKKSLSDKKLNSKSTLIQEKQIPDQEPFLEMEDAKTTTKKSVRSASADKRQKAVDLLKDTTTCDDDAEDFVDDTKHRIETKEDLFAAIGDTSLSAGKRSKQKNRRGTAEVSKEKVQEASKLVSEKQEQQNVKEKRSDQKSRTSSRERPKDLPFADTLEVETTNTDKRAIKSRTTSNERVNKEDTVQQGKTSRPSSRLQQHEDEEFLADGKDASFVQEKLKKVTKSRTVSQEEPTENIEEDGSGSSRRTVKSRTASKERKNKGDVAQQRTPSRPSSRLTQDAEEENISTVEVAGVHDGKKSRTTSRERPKDLPINETGLFSSKGRPVSVTARDEQSFNLDETANSTRTEDTSFKQSVVDSKLIRSRTTSSSRISKADRPKSRQSDDDVAREEAEEEMMQRYAARSKFAASRTSSSEDDAVRPRPSYPGKSQKSKNVSGDKQNSREQEVHSLKNIGDRSLEERPRSSASAKGSIKTKSRTASREQLRRSRTSSNEQGQMVEREDFLDAEEVAYEMSKKDHHPRRFRDEAALDLEEHEASGAHHQPFYDRSALDAEGMDDYDTRYQLDRDTDMLSEDEEPPPTEPIFDYNNAEITNGLGQSYNLRTGEEEGYAHEPDFEVPRKADYNGYVSDTGYFASEIEHSEDDLGNKVTRTKKVSFATEDEQFNMKPDPDVKVIPGTSMYCFAPSSTHEQSKDIVDGNKVSKTHGKSELAPKVKESAPNEPVSAPSQSPKTFLKQMISFDTGKNRSRDSSKEGSRRGDSRERSNSILDTLLKRGGASSSQGSQASSRQESMERGDSESGAKYNAGDTSKSGEYIVGENEENLISGTSSDPGKSRFLSRIAKKNKKLKIKPTDFDELFARGHALSAELEGAPPNLAMNGLNRASNNRDPQQATVFGTQPPASPTQPPTPFAMFSQENAFKQSQQEAGLTYEEKVKSYLDAQQDSVPFMPNKPMDYGELTTNKEQYRSDKEKQNRSRQRKKQSAQEIPTTSQSAVKRTPSYSKPEDVRIDQTDSEDVMSSASLPAASGGAVCTGGGNMAVSSYNRLRMARKDPAGEDGTQGGRSESTASHKRRQMTPEEFLKNLGDFVRKAEVDQHYAQPVWPANVQSPNELPPRKDPPSPSEFNKNMLQEASTLTSTRHKSPGDTGVMARPTSPYGAAANLRPSDQQSTLSPYTRGVSPVQRIAPSPGKSYLDPPSSLSPDPFQSRVEEQTAIDGAGSLPPLPSSSSAIETSSSILANLTKRTTLQQHHLPENQFDEPRIAPGDSHIPMQLKPDPLTAHEIMAPPQINIPFSDAVTRKDSETSIRDTDLYRRLQEGLSSIDKLVQGETFKSELSRSGVDYRKYSHHLGRAEFGVLKKRGSLGNLSDIEGHPSLFDKADAALTDDGRKLVGRSIQQSASATQIMGRTRFGGGNVGTSESSREPSKERQGSALGVTRREIGGTSQGGKRSSKQSSRDSSIGRPDSRLSDTIPDLEVEGVSLNSYGGSAVKRTGSSSSRGLGGDISGKAKRVEDQEEEERRLQEQLDIQPHPEMYERRQEVLQEMTQQKQTVKDAKVTKKVISGWGDGPEFTYVIDRTGGNFEKANGTAPLPPIRLRRGISPSPKVKSKPKNDKLPATEIRKIDFDRDTPIVKKQKTTTCCRHM